MKDKRLRTIFYEWAVPIAVFLSVTFLLTFNLLPVPYAVIGDNFAWTSPNIVDILGPKTIRESYMGDVALLSTFKTGFLFPVSYLFSLLNIPISAIYPFIFYFLSMLSFYSFSTEFLKKMSFRVIISIAYVINPVTPYYYMSLFIAFTLIFLPLAFKYFIKTLRQIDLLGASSSLYSKNFVLLSFFLGLSISAHEQFLPSAGIIIGFFIFTLIIVCYHKYNLTIGFVKTVFINIFTLAIVVILINTQELLSLLTITRASFSTYFTGRFHDFIANVRYTYSNSNILTLTRFGGDSGVGLQQGSWFDSSAPTNLLGYAFLIILLLSVLLILRGKQSYADKAFTWMNVFLFIGALSLILFIGYLPTDIFMAERVFSQLSLPMQAFESPVKLRVVLLLSALGASMFAFRELEEYMVTRRRKIVGTVLLGVFALSVLGYNSPWVLGYVGYTPVKQVSDGLSWGELYDEQYSDLSEYLAIRYSDQRGLVLPYTHKAELYVPPNFRLFQLFSDVNREMEGMTLPPSVSWSKLLGLLSTKYIVVKGGNYTSEWLLFPRSMDANTTRALNDLASDPGLRYIERFDNSTIFENENALPTTYATNFFVLYDDADTLRYAVDFIDFDRLPVFIGSGFQMRGIVIPVALSEHEYNVYALSLLGVYGSSLPLIVTNGDDTRGLNLTRNGTLSGLELYSATCNLRPGDEINSPPNGWVREREIDDLVVNSTSYAIGEYNNVLLNFTVNLLQKGDFGFLSPRVVIDTEDSTRYVLILHDDGIVELAVQKGSVFNSGVMMSFTEYDLKRGQAIDVSITMVFDKVEVRVDGEVMLTFPIGAGTSAISLSSEASTSRFTNISIATKHVIRLFTTRQESSELDFSVKQSGAERSTLSIQNSGGSDFAVVTQYLNTPSRNIESPVDAAPILANLFFNGWIINSDESVPDGTVLTIGVAHSRLTLALASFSIALTWSTLIAIVFLDERQASRLAIAFAKLKSELRSNKETKLG
jgi:hypothetical protein